MKHATPRQLQLVRYIHGFIVEHGYPPSMRELADHHGISVKGAMDHLNALANKGLIALVAGVARSTRITDKGLGLIGLGCPYCGGEVCQ